MRSAEASEVRGGGWALVAAGALLWIAAVLAPALWGIAEVARPVVAGAAQSPPESEPVMSLTIRTACWAAIVALAASALGWAPGRALARSLSGRGFGALALLCAVPICLPSYLVYYAWGLTWLPGSGIYRWAAAGGHAALAREATLFIGLAAWSWPIAAWCIAGAAAARPAEADELLRLDGAGAVRRLADRVRDAKGAILLGAAIVFVIIFNETASFDIAQVKTIGFELRALDSLGAPASTIFATGAAGIGIAVIGAAVAWRALGRSREEAPPRRAGARGCPWIAAIIWILSIGAPMALLVTSIRGAAEVRTVIDAYAPAFLHDLAQSAAAGGLTAIVAIAAAIGWASHSAACGSSRRLFRR
jgi:hypothetical protein